MKKLYITGVAGMLGGNVAYLLKEKYRIIGVDKVAVCIPKVNSEVLDLLDFEKLRENIQANCPDVILHCAAAVNVDLCEKDQKFSKLLNTTLTSVMAAICDDLKIKMIYISTDAVFDGEKETAYIEEDLPFPINNYGKTKLDGESFVLSNKNNLILRTNIYGYNIQDKSSLGEWILNSLLSNENIKMFNDVFFSPILVNELADIIDNVIQKNMTGIYHACGSGKISKYEFGVLIKQIFEISSGCIESVSVDTFKFDAKRAKNMSMNNMKLKKNINMNISTPIESIFEFKKLYDKGYSEEIKKFLI